MLTTDDRLGDYVFKSSPESCSDQSFTTDYMEIGSSDEDFLTQLSSDLDIPLLLNPGEDEMNILNSFFDKTPDEILSEVTSPPTSFHEDDSSHSSDSFELKPQNVMKENHPIPKFENHVIKSERSTPKPEVTYQLDIKDDKPEIKPIIYSPNPTKTIPIMPKYKLPIPVSSICTGSTISNVVIVDKRSVPKFAPITTQSVSVQPVIVKSSGNTVPLQSVAIGNRFVDPSMFKRQQRKIKNRESACLSRKRKKDYLNSLEDQVRQLSTENDALKKENQELKERLAQYEESGTTFRTKNISQSFVLCAVLLVVCINIDVIRNPFTTKSQLSMRRTEISKLPDHHGRNLLWASEEDSSENKTSEFLPLSMCPAAVNQTESARLALELERWIGVPSKPPNVKPNLPESTKLPPIKTKPVRTRRRKLKGDSSLVPLGPHLQPKNEIQVFKPNSEHLYSEFFEAINRQDDTFYVVSFSNHHMLLPALYHNKTRRPKMSLIMPSVLTNDNSTEALLPLMQIDCEVLNTKLLRIKYGSIPRQYRTNGNDSINDGPSEMGENGNESGEGSSRKYYKKQYKPYFIKKAALKPDEFYNMP